MKHILAILFLFFYLITGIYYLVFDKKDFYPFSSWILFSYIEKEGYIFDLEYLENANTKYLSENVLENQKPILGERLYKLNTIIKNQGSEAAYSTAIKIKNDYHITSQIKFVRKKIERLDFYKLKSIEKIEYVAVWK